MGMPYVFHPFHLVDLAHNSDLMRFDEGEIDEYAIARCEKYKKAIEIFTK